MSPCKSRIPQVVVLTQLTLKGQCDMLRGILRYVKSHGPWRLYRMEGRPGEQRLLDLRRWGCAGIITGPCHHDEAVLINRIGVPVIVCEPSPEMLKPDHPFARHTCVQFNSYACGRMAADYFVNRQYRHFAFVGEPHDVYWSRERGQGFKDTVERAGLRCHMYGSLSRDEKQDWAVEQPRLQSWLKNLPKPIALFAAMDGRGRQVLDACMGVDIAVPDEIAVLGVDNDELICEATFPTMSSIQTTGPQTGYWAAEHLDRLMRGARLRRRVIVGMPSSVETRRSTDATAIPDRRIAGALEYIWREAGHNPVTVPDVVKKIGSSRRFAEILFRTTVGRTILDEIQRVRLERVCMLLMDTHQSIGEITRQCGFERESYLAHLFKKRFNLTMRAYRMSARNRICAGTSILGGGVAGVTAHKKG